ncbi:MAG: hypothetical protein KDC95_00025 [Planctomycetes bacterium]|nr:hypothetical protein [Planctomycetota bacterium]
MTHPNTRITLMKNLAFVLSIAFVATGALRAQKTWIVDQANGPGTDFTDIQPAVDAASAGDRIRIRGGHYTAPRITKALTVYADFGGAYITTTTNVVVIENIPKGQTCTVAGFILEGTFVTVRNCPGTVALTGFAIARGFSPLSTIHVDNCDAVTVHGCALKSTIYANRSRVFLADTFLVPTLMINALIGTGISITDSELDVTNCILRGGDNGSFLGSSPAITAKGTSKVRVRGDSQTEVSGGGSGASQASCMLGSATSTLELDPRVTTGGPVSGFATVSKQKMVGLSAGFTFLTAATRLQLYGRQGEIGAVFVGITSAPKAWPGIGAWWLNSNAEVLLGASVFGSSESFTIWLQHLSSPQFLGLELGYQGLLLTSKVQMEFSAPVLQVVR